MNLIYMATPLYGGWVSFTTHLYHKYNDSKLYKITNKKENRIRDFGYDVKYQNLSITDIINLPNIIITAIDKNYYEYLDKFPDNTRIVIHDQTEIKNKILVDKLKRFQVITIRNTVHELLKTQDINNTFIYHPFYTYEYEKEENPNKVVSISRIDFDKNIDIILRANLSEDLENKIDIYGSENSIYTHHHLKNKLNLELTNYKGSFSKSYEELSNILKDAKFVIDMSTIQNDGGGSQYTFLEAIYHDCILILNSKWVNNLETEFINGYNCFCVSNEEELIEILNSEEDMRSIIINSKEILEKHINSDWEINSIKQPTKQYIVSKIISDEEIKKLEGKFFNDDGMMIFDEDVDIYTEDNRLLLKFRKNKINNEDCKTLFESKGAATPSKRPSASGIEEGKNKYDWIESQTTGKQLYVLTNKTKVNSGIIGYYDSSSNFGHHLYKEEEVKCRLTSYTSKNYDKFENCLPIFKKIDNIYKYLVPEFYDIQKNATKKIDPQFIIKDTIFTTVTVNKNFRTALHCDVGDLKEGFGNLVVVSEGEYTGGYTLFPQYSVGVNCQNGDFLAMDVHQWHCNSEKEGEGTRLSFVFYLREKMMKECPLIKVKKVKNKIKVKVKESAFMLFCKDERENIKKENLEITSQEIMVELGKRWNEIKLNNKERLKYYENKTENKLKEEKKKESPFMLFCKDERENIKKENKEITSREIMVELGKRWNEIKLHDKERLKYYENVNKQEEDENIVKEKKMTAFMLFCKDERYNIKRENLKLTSREVMVELSNRWRNVKLYDKDKINYYNSKL